jgi:hypothetical protein
MTTTWAVLRRAEVLQAHAGSGMPEVPDSGHAASDHPEEGAGPWVTPLVPPRSSAPLSPLTDATGLNLVRSPQRSSNSRLHLERAGRSPLRAAGVGLRVQSGCRFRLAVACPPKSVGKILEETHSPGPEASISSRAAFRFTGGVRIQVIAQMVRPSLPPELRSRIVSPKPVNWGAATDSCAFAQASARSRAEMAPDSEALVAAAVKV